MAYILNEEINQICAKANIVDIISSYNISLLKKGKDYKCVCPFHNDHSPSMSISVEKQIYKCFACGAAGNVFNFVENYENVSFGEAVRIVASKIGYALSGNFKINNATSVSKYQKEYELMDLITKYYQNNLQTKIGVDAKKYLYERGITDEIINDFSIGVAKDDATNLLDFLTSKNYDTEMLDKLGIINLGNNYYYDTFMRRITFPLCDDVGHIIGFSARIYRGEENSAKYINTKETYLYKKGNYLFNYHRAKDSAKANGYLVIVEGQMDAIRVYSTGIKNVVALMGTALTKEQINLIKKLRCKVIFCLDNDDAGRNATLKNGDLLIKENISVQVIKLSGAKDPDEYILKNGSEAFKINVDSPIDYFDFKLHSLKSSINENNSEELTGYINSIIEWLGEVSDPILRELTLSKISKEYNIDINILKERLKSLEKVSVVAKEVFSPKIIKKNDTNYDKLIKKVLLYMMSSLNYVKLYQKNLGYFEEKIYRLIANEIVYYSKTNGDINVADFLSYIKGNEELYDVVLEISCLDETLDENYFLLYLKKIKSMMQERKIKKLQQELKLELDKNKKLEIAKRITEVKKGSVM